MDNLTLLSVISSVITIVCFFMALFTTTSKDTSFSHNNVNIDNSITVDESLNINSHNLITTNYNFPTKSTSDYNSTNNNIYLYVILFLLLGGIVSAFYLKNQYKIVLYVGFSVAISMSITLLCSYLLTKRSLIHKRNLYLNLLKSMPLFILLTIIYHPSFHSNDLIKVEMLLKKGTGFFNIFTTYSHEVSFLFFQIIGLAIILICSVLNVITILKQTYNGLRHESIAKEITFKDLACPIAVTVFIYLCISGSLITLWNLYIGKINSFN